MRGILIYLFLRVDFFHQAGQFAGRGLFANGSGFGRLVQGLLSRAGDFQRFFFGRCFVCVFDRVAESVFSRYVARAPLGILPQSLFGVLFIWHKFKLVSKMRAQ